MLLLLRRYMEARGTGMGAGDEQSDRSGGVELSRGGSRSDSLKREGRWNWG